MKGRKQISSRLLKSSTATVYQFVFSLWKSCNLSATVQICIIYLWFLISLTNIKLLNSYCTELYKGICDSLYSGWAATPGRGVFNRASAREQLVNARQNSLYPQHKYWRKLALLKLPQFGGLSPSWLLKTWMVYLILPGKWDLFIVYL